MEEVLTVVNDLLDRVTESLENPSPVPPSPPSPAQISSPISEERFPSPSRYDPVSSPFSSPSPPLSPTCYSPPPVSPIPFDDFPLSPSPSSTSSVEFLGEIPAPASPIHPQEEFPFIPIITHFPQANSPPPPGAYTVGPGPVDLDHLRRVVSTANPDHGIYVYLPGIPLPYLIPISFFFNHFPPSSVTLNEL